MSKTLYRIVRRTPTPQEVKAQEAPTPVAAKPVVATLTVHLIKLRGTKRGQTVTQCYIRFEGKTLFAFRNLIGDWTEEQARKEFRKQPGLFSPGPKFCKFDLLTYANLA